MSHEGPPERPIERGAAVSRADVPIWMLVTLVLTLTFAAYWGSLDFQFVHDDRGQIVNNPAVHSWRYVRQYFTAHVWAHVDPNETGNYYRPLFLLWLRVNDMLFDSHPWWWHLTTVLAHLATTLAVYFLARRILEDKLTAVVAALVFGLHPVHIEAVAWVSGVTEPLLGILFISSFLCYLRGRERRETARKWMGFSLVLFALALLEKETAIMLPALVFAYEWIYWDGAETARNWQNRARRFAYALKYAAPFLALVPPYLVVRIFALKGFSPGATPLPFSTLVFTWPSLGWFWIKHLIWPVGLSTSYDFFAVSAPNWANFSLPLVGGVAALAGLFWVAQRSRPIAFASVWLLVPLVPLLDIRAFVEDDFAHDRYLYLPSVGFAMLLALALRRVPGGRMTKLGLPAAQTGIALALALLMIFDAVYQSFYFADDQLFYQHNARMAPNNRMAKNNLAMLLYEQGRPDLAITILKDLVEKHPADWGAVHNLGYMCYRTGRLADAKQYFTRAIQINRAKPDSHLYLGLTMLKTNRIEEAEAQIRQAIRIRPGGYGYHFALGMVMKSRGDLRDALDEFRVELANSPTETAAREQVMEIEGRLQQEENVR
jgi:tetratricopeptide (TPR) repeat protein